MSPPGPAGGNPLLHARFTDELAAAGLPAGPGPRLVVTEEDLAPLPEPAQRFHRFMRTPGRPRDWSFTLHCAARFKPALDAEWRPAEVWQYNSSVDVARVHHMQLQFYGVPVVGRGLYLRGAGRLVIRPLDLVTVEDDRGPALDAGELLTWLNDAILLAPSMLLDARTLWTAAGSDSFGVSFTDAGRTVTAHVIVDPRGAPVELDTDMRCVRNPAAHHFRRARWSTPISAWQDAGGRRLPTGCRAVWQLPSGDFAYAELTIRPGDVVYNMPPDGAA